jgi:hypothetical protein
MAVLRIAKISDSSAPANVEEGIAKCDPAVVVGPEWARPLSVGRIFVPQSRKARCWITLIKRAWLRENGSEARFDEVEL